MSLDITVTLKTLTCSKGHLYAVPHWCDAPCPFCAKQEHARLSDLLDQRWDEIRQFKRANAALRGTIAKLRKSRKTP